MAASRRPASGANGTCRPAGEQLGEKRGLRRQPPKVRPETRRAELRQPQAGRSAEDKGLGSVGLRATRAARWGRRVLLAGPAGSRVSWGYRGQAVFTGPRGTAEGARDMEGAADGRATARSGLPRTSQPGAACRGGIPGTSSGVRGEGPSTRAPPAGAADPVRALDPLPQSRSDAHKVNYAGYKGDVTEGQTPQAASNVIVIYVLHASNESWERLLGK